MSKIVKYGDFFLDPTKQRRIRNMRREVREQRIKEYIKRAEKELPLFEGDKKCDLTNMQLLAKASHEQLKVSIPTLTKMVLRKKGLKNTLNGMTLFN